MSETRSVETTAADIETAIEIGLEQLGVARESVIVEILEEPSRGLLGIGARQARIRLTTAARPRPTAAPVVEAAPVAVKTRTESVKEIVETADEDDETPEVIMEDAVAVSEADMDDDARVGKATLQELLDKMQIEAEIAVYRAAATKGEEAPWVLQMRGRDLGMLIGRRGETLAALQYVTRLIVSRELERRANIVLDVEGYKSRREQMLHKLAVRMADQAMQLGRTVALEPMSPYERRIIHLALRDHSGVTTQSIGEGEHRKVTIIPRRR
jgi:spoIIIJ-associated protein